MTDPQKETMEQHISELENPIIEIELIQPTLHKLAEYIERDDDLREIMFRVIGDLDLAIVKVRNRFNEMAELCKDFGA